MAVVVIPLSRLLNDPSIVLLVLLVFLVAGAAVICMVLNGAIRVAEVDEVIERAATREVTVDTEDLHDLRALEHGNLVEEGKFLNHVIYNRIKAASYHTQLGIFQKAEKVLVRILDALWNRRGKALLFRKDDIFPRGDPRIVLIIDNLDRCPPDKVMEMLEALQLLAKMEFFLMVVAIDTRLSLSRWKTTTSARERGSLKIQTPSGLDYLEMIIQLPYWVPSLRPLDKRRAIGRYIQGTQENQLDTLTEDNVVDQHATAQDDVVSAAQSIPIDYGHTLLFTKRE
jgi:hypothetical protein